MATTLLKGWRQFGGLWWLLPCFCINARKREQTESYSERIQALEMDWKVLRAKLSLQRGQKWWSPLAGQKAISGEREGVPRQNTSLAYWAGTGISAQNFRVVQQPKEPQWNRRDPRASTARAGLWDGRGASCAQAQPAKPAACQPRLSTWPPAPLLH